MRPPFWSSITSVKHTRLDLKSMNYAETREENENLAKEEMILQHLKCCNSSFDLELDSEIDSFSLEDHKNQELPVYLEYRNRHGNEDEMHTDDEIGKMPNFRFNT